MVTMMFTRRRPLKCHQKLSLGHRRKHLCPSKNCLRKSRRPRRCLLHFQVYCQCMHAYVQSRVVTVLVRVLIRTSFRVYTTTTCLIFTTFQLDIKLSFQSIDIALLMCRHKRSVHYTHDSTFSIQSTPNSCCIA